MGKMFSDMFAADESRPQTEGLEDDGAGAASSDSVATADSADDGGFSTSSAQADGTDGDGGARDPVLLESGSSSSGADGEEFA